MCGICGIYAYGPKTKAIDADELVRTREHMCARGPDAGAHWVGDDHTIGLGHRRLAIIDVDPRSTQPMWSADRRYAIVFNGEIYNYKPLREELIKAGVPLRTTSDTEVLLELFQRCGKETVKRLRGMYAFAIWDTVGRRLFLARDPYGIKPLYYSDAGGVFRFASSARALVAGGGISAAPDAAGWVGFFLLGSVPEPHTTFEAISQLPAGCMMEVGRDGATAPERFFSISAILANAGQSASGRPASLRTAVLDSVAHHMIADVPVGCFLSAGVDSNTLLGIMRESSQREVTAVTLAFGEFAGTANDEAPLAAIAAARFGARHIVRYVSHSDFEASVDPLLQAMDQPSIDGMNTYFVSKAAHELGLKVAVSGLGGDELFGGYPSFSDVPRWRNVLSPIGPKRGRQLRFLLTAIEGAFGIRSRKLGGLMEFGSTLSGAYFARRGLFMPWELPNVLAPEFVAAGIAELRLFETIEKCLEPDPGSDHARICALESQLYMRNQLLRDTDWASMAHSLEVRVPLVDTALLASVAAMQPSPRKGDLSRCSEPPLPAAVRTRRKTGFSTPIGGWLLKVAQDRSRAPLRPHDASRQIALFVASNWPHANAPAFV